MSILKKILLGLVVVVALLIAIGFLLPSSAHVERSIAIDAPSHTVFALVNSFRNFNKWSPWAKRDPETEYQMEGPEAGEGAKMSWASENPQVGTGSQQIVVSEPFSLVRSHLDFGSQGTAEAFFEFEPTDTGTSVTWGFDTEFGANLVSRYMGLMFDNWIGADYEAGLANLKTLAEGMRKDDWTALEIEVVDLEPTLVAYTSGSTPWEYGAIGQNLGQAYGQIGQFMAANQLQFAGQPIAVTTSYDDQEWRFDAAIPIAGTPADEIDPASPVQIREIPGGKVVRGVSVGSYRNTSENWDKVMAFAEAHGYEHDGPPREQYISDPGDTPEEELITHLILPIR